MEGDKEWTNISFETLRPVHKLRSLVVKKKMIYNECMYVYLGF